MKVFEENFKVARDVAAEGMVLIKNEDNVLPFKKGEKIAPIGKGCFSLLHCGEGSASVYCAYVKSVVDGLKEKQADGKISVNKTALFAYNGTDKYADDVLDEIAKESDTVLVSIARKSGEACDRKLIKGEFYLTDEEVALFEQLENNKYIKNVVVLLNYAGNYDMRFINEYSKIKSAMIIWLPGMEGGSAVADLLVGDKTPSGKLTSTIAKDYYCYPSSSTFLESDTFVRYEEDIYVGYRYFETFEDKKDDVLYPFGFGLSYTKFEISDAVFTTDDEKIYITATVKNTGDYFGKEVVQVYSSAPDKALEKPKYELKGYKKTKLLAPNESEQITIEIEVKSLSSFDDTGVSGYQGCYVLEDGIYDIYIGNCVRNFKKAGSFFIDETVAVEKCGLKLSSPISKRLEKSGINPQKIGDEPYKFDYNVEKFSGDKLIMLQDVADKKASIKQFLAQLSIDELIELSYSQPPTFPRGTAGIGNLRKYGVPNIQTADGPNGLRKTTPTTCFPCSNLVGCTFNEDLQFAVGKAIGKEGVETQVDVLLAPGLCIQRDPLNGRNFEYFSEDPVVSGNAAAAYVKGAQSSGILATVKHFCCNNKEENRYFSNSILSERALREIYLKGFEIAVKTANPAFVMTSYNLVNSTRTSCYYGLLNGILREEWGFEGAVMTDWRVPSHHFDEILAGNNIKMPYGYPEELALTKKMYEKGVVTREILENNVEIILNAIMKSDMFKRKDLGRQYTIKKSGKTRLSAIDFTGVTGTWVKMLECDDVDNEYCLGNTAKDFKGNDIAIYYDANIEEDGDYELYFRIDSEFSSSWLEVNIDNKPVAVCGHIKTREHNEKQHWVTIEPIVIHLPKGNHEIKFFVRDAQKDRGINLNWIEFVRV